MMSWQRFWKKALGLGGRSRDNSLDAATNRCYAANKAISMFSFEASGNERAVRSGLEVLAARRPGVQLGLGGDVSIPQNMVSGQGNRKSRDLSLPRRVRLGVASSTKKRVDLTALLTGALDGTRR